MFLVDEIAEKLAAAQDFAASNDWQGIVDLLPWERLVHMHGQVTARHLVGHPSQRVAALAHLRSYADLARADPSNPRSFYLGITIQHLETMHICKWYDQDHIMMFELRLAQCYHKLGREYQEYISKAVDRAVQYVGNNWDLAATLLVRGTFEFEHAKKSGHSDDMAKARATVSGVLRLMRQSQVSTPATRRLYSLACLWLAAIHHAGGHKWRAAWFAQFAGRLKWDAARRTWVIQWGGSLAQPVPFIVPTAFV